MLYPDFNELVALKDRKLSPTHTSTQTATSTVSGSYHSPFRGQGLEFDSVRQYVPGDDVRNIDWRVTARSGSPHLKLFQEERERSVILCVDRNSSMQFGTKNTFKSIQAARAAALFGWQALSNHDRLGACLFGDVADGVQLFAPKRTRASLWAMLTALCQPPPSCRKIFLEEALKQIDKVSPAGSLVVVISDFMDLANTPEPAQAGSKEDFASVLDVYLCRLKKRCDVLFVAINDPADMAFYPVGTVVFRASSGEEIFVNTDSIAGRDAYAGQWRENRRRLHALASQLGIPLIALTTESDLPRDLIIALKQIGKRRRR